MSWTGDRADDVAGRPTRGPATTGRDPGRRRDRPSIPRRCTELRLAAISGSAASHSSSSAWSPAARRCTGAGCAAAPAATPPPSRPRTWSSGRPSAGEPNHPLRRGHHPHRTGQGWLYLAVVLDVFSRRRVGHRVPGPGHRLRAPHDHLQRDRGAGPADRCAAPGSPCSTPKAPAQRWPRCRRWPRCPWCCRRSPRAHGSTFSPAQLTFAAVVSLALHGLLSSCRTSVTVTTSCRPAAVNRRSHGRPPT